MFDTFIRSFTHGSNIIKTILIHLISQILKAVKFMRSEVTNQQLYDQNSLLISKMECLLSMLVTWSNKIMFNVADLQAAMEKAVADTAAEQVQVQGALAAQAASIQALTEQIANMSAGGLVTQEQLDALVVAAQGISAAVEAIYVPAV